MSDNGFITVKYALCGEATINVGKLAEAIEEKVGAFFVSDELPQDMVNPLADDDEEDIRDIIGGCLEDMLTARIVENAFLNDLLMPCDANDDALAAICDHYGVNSVEELPSRVTEIVLDNIRGDK